MVKKRGLGKSLDALLSLSSSERPNAIENENFGHEKIINLHVNQILRGKYQPRREMSTEALEDLAASIRQQGIIQPLLVRPAADNKHEIIAGERRFRAAQMAGLLEVPVIIRHIPDEAAIAIALIENIQRENLNPIEEAFALERLIEEFGMTHQQVADAVGKSRASVTNLLRLLALSEEIKTMLAQRQLEMGHARSLLTLPEATQLQVARMIVLKSLSVRDTEQVVRRIQAPQTTKSNKHQQLDVNLLDIQESLAKQLKLRVALQCNAAGKGKLIVHYRSLAELDSLLSHLQSN